MMKTARILCAGVSHETAPLVLRERLAGTLLERGVNSAAGGRRDAADRPPVGRAPRARIEESVLLITCNRVELYAAVSGEPAAEALAELLVERSEITASELATHLYVYEDETAVRHLLRVAAGLESLVLGEPQILGQVGSALRQAQAQAVAGPLLTTLFRAAQAAGKRVRRETAIGRSPASVPSLAINQAQAALGSLKQKNILVIGAGAMAQTAIKALRARGLNRIAVANRTLPRAAALAGVWGGEAYPLEALGEAVSAADVVFCATHAGRALLTRELVAAAIAGRAERPLWLFDLSMPRNIAAAAGQLPGVTLTDLDRLRADLDESLAARRREVPAAEAILAEEEARLHEQLAELALRPVIAGLRQKAELIRQRELSRALRRLGDVDPQTLDQFHHLSRALVNQLLHEPTLRLRRSAYGDGRQTVIEAARDLFNLDLNEEQSPL